MSYKKMAKKKIKCMLIRVESFIPFRPFSSVPVFQSFHHVHKYKALCTYMNAWRQLRVKRLNSSVFHFSFNNQTQTKLVFHLNGCGRLTFCHSTNIIMFPTKCQMPIVIYFIKLKIYMAVMTQKNKDFSNNIRVQSEKK